MNTPICDFVKKYSDSKVVRAHMPGHKGEGVHGVEHLDITEIKGADSLFDADSIIKESERNASTLFGAHTYYSAEGSSLSIRAMLYLCLLYAKSENKAPLILCARNVHRAFVSAAALLDFDVEWMYGSDSTYLSCNINADALDNKLNGMTTKPVAFYLTSPDYLGNMADIKSLADICKKHNVLLIIDNAHGAYLKFMSPSLHPIDLGTTMCCDSAHKTLPVLTGGAYLHISKTAPTLFTDKAKQALALFASTSPSYLILQSLDMANKILSSGYADILRDFIASIDALKNKLKCNGYTLYGNEPLKITICTKAYGYNGTEFADILRTKNIECEFCDPDFVVLMLAPTKCDTITIIESALLSISKRDAIASASPTLKAPQKKMSIRDATLSNSKTVKVKDSIKKILASVTVSCPPAVPIVVSGEVIDETALQCFEYYGITHCEIIE